MCLFHMLLWWFKEHSDMEAPINCNGKGRECEERDKRIEKRKRTENTQ